MGVKSKPASLVFQVSAGGVIFKKDNGVHVCMIIPEGSSVLTLPKGLVDTGESPEVTALREVKEETGLEAKIIKKLGEVSYWFYIKKEQGENVRCKKTVHFYLMKYIKGSLEDHDREVKEALWLPIDEAIKKAEYKTDREILKKALKEIEQLHEEDL